MAHAASIGAGASAAHAAPATPASSARTPAAPAAAGASTGSSNVSLSHEGQARVDNEAGGSPDALGAAQVVAHLALAALGEPDGLVGDAVQVAAGYAAQAGLDLAGRIDEIV
jgi:hypothetical protein